MTINWIGTQNNANDIATEGKIPKPSKSFLQSYWRKHNQNTWFHYDNQPKRAQNEPNDLATQGNCLSREITFSIIVLTININQTQTKRVILLQQSTETNQTILWPQIPVKFIEIVTDHV